MKSAKLLGLITALAASIISLGPAHVTAAPKLTWASLRARPRPQPTRTVAYGPDPLQYAQLWLPDGPGPYPVVVLIHGGCWTTSIADLTYFNYGAEDLRQRGLAVWSVEYRGVDKPGGGYPGTFQDVAAALQRLVQEAPSANLSLKHLVVAGHSAGGHLALWAAGQHRIAADSPLHADHPIKIAAVVDIAGIPNLKTDTNTACGADVIGQLTGRPTAARPDVYADTSPAALLPLGVPQVVIHGLEDVTVAPSIGEAYAKAARAAGDHVVVKSPPGDHVDEVAPDQPAWAVVATTIVALAHGGPIP
jgi:acetyl esterase/lipase